MNMNSSFSPLKIIFCLFLISLTGCQYSNPCDGNEDFIKSLKLGTSLASIEDDLLNRSENNYVSRFKLKDGREVIVFQLSTSGYCARDGQPIVFVSEKLEAVGLTGYRRLLDDYDLKVKVD